MLNTIDSTSTPSDSILSNKLNASSTRPSSHRPCIIVEFRKFIEHIDGRLNVPALTEPFYDDIQATGINLHTCIHLVNTLQFLSRNQQIQHAVERDNAISKRVSMALFYPTSRMAVNLDNVTKQHIRKSTSPLKLDSLHESFDPIKVTGSCELIDDRSVEGFDGMVVFAVRELNEEREDETGVFDFFENPDDLRVAQLVFVVDEIGRNTTLIAYMGGKLTEEERKIQSWEEHNAYRFIILRNGIYLKNSSC